MSSVLFWDVDTQKDFVLEGGALPVPGAEGIRGNLARLSKLVEFGGYRRVKTGDWHSLDDEEIVEEDPDFASTFPPHCMAGSNGATFIPETSVAPGRRVIVVSGKTSRPVLTEEGLDAPDLVLYKNKFNVFAGNKHADAVLEHLDPSRVYVYGVSGNVCVAHAVNGLINRGYEVTVVEDAVASLPGSSELPSWSELVDQWTKQGVGFATTEQVVEGFA